MIDVLKFLVYGFAELIESLTGIHDEYDIVRLFIFYVYERNILILIFLDLVVQTWRSKFDHVKLGLHAARRGPTPPLENVSLRK